MPVSYYRILGVSPTANHGELKKAYRDLARRFHPDRNQGHPLAESRFRLISEAWSVLGEAEDRKSMTNLVRLASCAVERARA